MYVLRLRSFDYYDELSKRFYGNVVLRYSVGSVTDRGDDDIAVAFTPR